MADNQQTEKRQFTVPSRDELIQQIKQLDQDIEHVTLNLIKCDFNATEKDVEKTFPDIHFVKVKNYNPGSFEVVFEMKIDAINFIRNHYDKKILNRRFFIKMGRQQKQLVQDWTGVGYVPKTFKGPHKPQHHQNKQGGIHKPRRGEQHHEGKTEEKTVEGNQAENVVIQQKQIKSEIKQNDKNQEEAHKAQKKQGKHIPKKEFHNKKEGYHKKIVPTSQTVPGTVITEGEKTHSTTTHQSNKGTNNKQTTTHTNVQKGHHQTHAKRQEQPQTTKLTSTNPKGTQTVSKKQEKKQKQESVKQTTKQPETKEDDGWIVVGKKQPNKKR